MDAQDQALIEKPTKALTPEDMARLKTHFVRLYKRPVPKRVSPTFLHGNVAWGLQAEVQGDDPLALRAELLALAQNAKINGTSHQKVGTQLLREWKGQTYIVTRTETGYTYEEETYTSLTAIAKIITGNHISGPRFFGLKK